MLLPTDRMGQMAVGLNPLKQVVNPASGNFTPNLTLNGWFQLHWYRFATQDALLTIKKPTGLLVDGQEFVIDIWAHNEPQNADSESVPQVVWEYPFYRPMQYCASNGPQGGLSAFFYPWDGWSNPLITWPEFIVRHRYLWLGGYTTLQAMNFIYPLT